MKKNYILIMAGLVVGALTLTGCQDSFLEQEPPTKAPVDEYFSTEEHINENLFAAYVPARMYDYDGVNFAPLNWFDLLGDDMLVGAAGPTDQEVWHLAADYRLTSQMTLTNYWDESYTGIRLCNETVDYLHTNQDKLAAAYATAAEAEARVLRAFYYTVVWKAFGNIPYFTETLTAESHAPQLSVNDAYEAIVSDLEGAIALNALPMKQTDDTRLGRMTQAAAYMIYADLVMYQNDQTRFAKALDYMQQLINGTDYQLDQLGYAHLWSADGEWGDEGIFEINYTDGAACVRSYENVGGIGGTFQGICLAPDGGYGDAISGWGTFIVRRTTYDLYAANDSRRDVSCFVAAEGAYSPRYQDQGVFCGKYIGRNWADGTGGADHCRSNQNLRVYRYAETLLNAAELLVRTGGDQTLAKSYVTQVRQRAGLVSEVEPTLDNIMQERRLEFLGEGKRYWDLVRMEGVSGVSAKASALLTPDLSAVNSRGDRGRQHAWTLSKKYFPIAAVELAGAEGTLQQNSAYLEN